MNQMTPHRRRSLGSYYTPEWIARAMVARCLVASDVRLRSKTWRMLDPACGDGAFVLAVLDQLARTDSDRLSLVRQHVFGVDADSNAIDSLRQRVAAWIGPIADAHEVDRVLHENFHCGDALLGADLIELPVKPSPESSLVTGGLDWRAAFPNVAMEGGFDLVIGNPPYRRELNARVDFDRIAATPLGRRWRRARMDLWHYFLHRGLDLLKPAGTLCYIVNSYWTGSTAAKPLVERLSAETTMDEIVLFGSASLFRGVTGRHMIFRARKCVDQDAACRIVDLSEIASSELQTELAQISIERTSPERERLISQSDLWRGGHVRVEPIGSHRDLPDDGPLLGKVFEVRQGIAENPPFVTKAIAIEMGDPLLAGRGVFVLTTAEVESLELSASERSLLRPYFALPSVERFRLAPEPSHWLLYLTKRTAPLLKELPRIAAHLEPFRAALERRREVRSGTLAWWHLHWPREERLFTAPRVLCKQMVHAPSFVFAERSAFVGFSMHVIVEWTLPVGCATAQKRAGCSLGALAAILNSSAARSWFETHAKRRGANLDISGSVLKQFPLPSSCRPNLEVELNQLSRDWPSQSDSNVLAADIRLNQLVNEWYELPSVQ